MKTFTFVICILLSAIASYATAAASGSPAPFTVCLEAEKGNGDGPFSPDPNASNGLTRGAQNGPEYFVEYVTNVPSTSKYKVTLRYYAERNALVNVSVNGGKPFQVELPASHSWNIAWTEHTIEVNLIGSTNRIRIQELPGYDVRQDKICWTEIPGTEWTITCDYQVNPWAVGNPPSYQPGQTVTLDARCSGSDCDVASMAWIGNEMIFSGEVASFAAPATPGDYTYTLFATRYGCTTDTSVNLTIHVQNTSAECDYVVGSILSDYTPACGQGMSVSADCFGTGCAGLTYKWNGPGLDAWGSTVNFYAPTQNGTYTYTRTSSKPGCADQTSDFQLTVTSCGDGPYSICLEAENALGSGPITEDPNASGGKTKGGQDRQDYTVSYQVHDVQAEGPHAITFRYYAEANTAIEVTINNEIFPYKIELPSSDSWNIVWTERTVVFALQKGLNFIEVKGMPGYSPVRHDKICIEQTPGTPPACDFVVVPHLSTFTPQCGSQITLSSNCSGADCGPVFYNWYGPDGYARYTKTIDVPVPAANGTYYYTLVAGKEGCASRHIPVSFTVNDCASPSGETSACVEAENMASNGAGTSDPNASNGQTRGSQNNYDYYVDYQLNDFAAGTYAVRLRYYAEASAQVSVSVNGNIAIAALQLPPTYSWNIAAREETFYITLAEGQNTIRIQGLPGAAARQDRICVGNSQNNARIAVPEFLQTQSDASLLQAYPNPASGEFKAVFNLPTGKPATVRVVDVQGKIWHSRNVAGKGTHEERINLGNAPAGIYLLEVKKPDSVETKKILLTR